MIAAHASPYLAHALRELLLKIDRGASVAFDAALGGVFVQSALAPEEIACLARQAGIEIDEALAQIEFVRPHGTECCGRCGGSAARAAFDPDQVAA